MMGEEAMDFAGGGMVEAILRDELAREERALGSVVPVLRHLLASEGQTLVSDAILARVRGMLADLAAQMLAVAEGRDAALRMSGAGDTAARDMLANALAGDPALLSFCHALATESQLALRLQQRSGIDPVLSPLLQELIASDMPAIAELAMNTLAAQSRFIQSQRRMELPLGELPAELFHALVAGVERQIDDAAGIARLQQTYDEGASRLGLLARLVSTMRRGAVAALALDHAGLALFSSALAALARQPRAAAVIACHEGQGARLALGLRAAGLGPEAIERQFLAVQPSARITPGIADVSPDQARLLLAAGQAG
ncbi:hypothetical protein [Erythrobacter sanguineus]|uniref:Uncharacterized protein n=1 Tax=Erythrobacter sanguineus TaxID=198312 RepID=A0A1M7S5U1_9SPHN|nr:hypothetical protein [Erythrobacter sanguineus]SHN53783.1 hypothetical protein SAMN02745193_01027 [Erythrobacter sanguineus]